jgi:hypothetical protein
VGGLGGGYETRNPLMYRHPLTRVGGGGGFYEKVFDMRQKGLRRMDKYIERKVFPKRPTTPHPGHI